MRASAETTSPASKIMMSPGTKKEAFIRNNLPFRNTIVAACPILRKVSKERKACNSIKKPMETVIKITISMAIPSAQSLKIKASNAAAVKI